MGEAIQHIDMDMLSEIKDVMEDDFGVLIETYLQDSVNRITAIREAIGASDCEALRRAAHSFKGSCSNVGAALLAEHLRQLEELGKDNKLDGADGLLVDIENEYNHVREALVVL